MLGKTGFRAFFFAAISIVKVAAMALTLLPDDEILARLQGLSFQQSKDAWLTANQKPLVATAIEAIEAAMLKVPIKKRRSVWYHWWRTYVDRKHKTGVPAPSRDNTFLDETTMRLWRAKDYEGLHKHFRENCEAVLDVGYPDAEIKEGSRKNLKNLRKVKKDQHGMVSVLS